MIRCEKWFFDMGDNFEDPIKSAQGENLELFFAEFFKKFLKFPEIYFGHDGTTQ